MTKEELKKEIKNYIDKNCNQWETDGLTVDDIVRIAVLDFAEPREKRIKELENKIADIKANCDLAIEGRDIKIKELELELTVEKDQHQEETVLHLHAEEYIKSLEQQIEKMMCCENCAYRTVDLLTFKPFCDKRKLGIENPLTCKCDKWEIKENG